MSFSYSAGVITQTGTDTGLTGLSGLTGVSHTNNTYHDVYTIDASTELVINGTLTMNPEIEMLVCRRTPGNFNNAITVDTGTFNIGSNVTVNSFDRQQFGTAIYFDNHSANAQFSYNENWANLRVLANGTMNWYGGSILSSGPIYILGNFNTYSTQCVLQGNSQGDAQIRQFSSTASINGLTVVGFRLTLITPPASISGYTPIHAQSAIDMSGASTQSSFYLFSNLVTGKGNTRDFGGKNTTYTRFLDSSNGSNLIVESQTPATPTDQDYLLESRSQVTLTYIEQNGTSIPDIKVYCRDTDNGSRLADSTIGTAQPSYVSDRTYTGTSDGSGMIAFDGATDSVLLSVHWHSNEDGAAIYDFVDYRGNQNSNSDKFTFKSIGYAWSLSSLTYILKGNNGFASDWTLTPDLLITQTTKATVDAYTTINSAYEFYDRAKSYLYDNFSGEVSPIISRNGNVINAGALNITIDATTGSAFAFDDSTITIKSSNFVGNINTSGTFTLDNGATLDGVLNGQLAVTDGATYTEDIDGKFVVDTDTVTSFTISGFVPTEIEHIGSGSATIFGTNNAKLVGTTITATGGTLTLGDGLNPSSNWTIGSGTITLTTSTTEANLLGLRGLADVDYIQQGAKFIYSTSSRIIIDGTLTVNPVLEQLRFLGGTVDNGKLHLNGGTLTIDDQLNLYGEDVSKENIALYFEGTGGSPWDGTPNCNILFQTGTFVMNGGTIFCAGGIRWQNSMTLFQIRNSVFDGNRNGVAESVWYCSAGLDKFDVIGWELIGGKFEVTTTNYSPINFSGVQCSNSDKGLSGGPDDGQANVFWEVQNYQGNDTQQDYSVWDNKKIRFINSEPVAIGVNQLNDGRSRGIGEETFKLRFAVNDTNGDPISGAKMYSTDTDNGSRVDMYAQDYVTDRIYTGTSDGNGNLDMDALVEVTVVDSDRGSFGAQTKDTRYTGRIIVGKLIAYDKSIFDWSYDASTYMGTDDFVPFSNTLIADLLITQSVRATVDAYPTINSAYEFYDRAKSELVVAYAGEASTTVTRTATSIDLMGLDLTVNAGGATIYDLTESALTIKSSNYTGGFSNGTISHGSGNPVFTNLVLENATWNVDQATWTGSADADTTIDIASTGTYDATGFTFDASSTLNNSSGGTINIVISTGQQQPAVTGGGTTNFLTRGAVVTFNNLASSNIQIIENDTVTVNQRSVSQTGTLVYNTPNGSSGTWKYVVDRPGWDPIIGSFPANGADVTVDGTLAQKQQPDGAPMYAGTTSAFLTVVPNPDGSRLNLRIGDGFVSGQEAFDEVEDAIATEDGMTYLSNGGGQVALGIRPTGTFLDLYANVRLIRDLAGDANATLVAFVSSTDGIILDNTNGAVQFVTPTSNVNIVSVNSVSVTDIDDFKADVSALATQASVDTVDGIVDAILVDTGTTIPAQITALNNLSAAQVASELATYDGPKKIDLIVRTATAQAGTSTTITLDASASAVNSFYNNTVVYIKSGTGAGQSRRISAYVGATKVATVANSWQTNPNATSVFNILPQAQVNATLNSTQSAQLSAIETKTQADARQALLISAHGATQTTLSEIKGGAWSDETLVNIKSSIDALALSSDPVNYTSTSAVRTEGDDDGGDNTNVQSQDNTFMVTGETINGLEVLFTRNASSINEIPTSLRIVGFYSSNSTSHNVRVQVWNYTHSLWDNVGLMVDRNDSFDYAFPINNEHHNGSGEMQCRLIHNVVGDYKTQHTLNIDYVVWQKVESNQQLSQDIAQILAYQQELLSAGLLASGEVVSSTVNTITLGGNAEYVDGSYDPAILKITSGAGAGQTRNILEYNGSTRTAVVNRDWKVAPDSTSTYIIHHYSDIQTVNEGLAQGGTSNTLTLNTTASTVDDTYIGQLLFLVSGTGQDQTGLVIDYDGTSKVATIAGNWTTTPTTDTAYIMLPASPVILGDTNHPGTITKIRNQINAI